MFRSRRGGSNARPVDAISSDAEPRTHRVFREIVVGLLRGPVRHAAVSFTGGEPLLQPWVIRALAPAVRAAGVKVLLETDANLDASFSSIRDCIDIVSMDWKFASATGEPVRESAHRNILAASRGSRNLRGGRFRRFDDGRRDPRGRLRGRGTAGRTSL
jgi:pyruvate-formate lyase-activating enzyme